MDLYIQINSLLFSLCYGFFFGLTLNFSYNNIFKGLLYFKLINNFLFIFCHVLLYFILLKKINNGIMHPYFLLLFIVGFAIIDNKIKR
ncbi:MAG: spore cortex biosynthesis protein YabQ [Bacilli bacterium]|jgi:hypothetical protein